MDPVLAAHCSRAGELAADIAKHLGLSPERIELLKLASQLHDIGKVFISRDILDKPGPLTKAEWAELRHHPRLGYDLVADHVPTIVADVVLTHHERFDGTGYPEGISGPRIPFEARVLQAADAIDAITSERPYQPALPLEYALNELQRFSGSQFDPTVVDVVMTLAHRDSRLPLFASVAS
jgi:HD-GYP domain-containing protein (c-di-GMP phosphodiesterase class II)